jgi:hypothetical protein
MPSKLLISVPCRVYGLIASAAGLVTLILSVVFLTWAKLGPPPDLLAELGPSMSAAEFKRLSMGLGVMFLVFGILHAVVGVLALLGRTWAMIAGTVAWAVFLTPSMFANQASAYDCASVIVLGALCLLTLLTLAGRFAATDETGVAAA